MKAVAAFVVFTVLVAVASASSDLEAQFKAFVGEHSKVYADEQEYQLRFRIFKANMKTAAFYQANDAGTALYGVTPFSDMTPDEFRIARLVPAIDAGDAKNSCLAHGVRMPELRNDPTPTSVDWRDKNAVTPVKNQGGCGSCWTFSTTGNIESQWFLAGHPLISLSEQQIVDCDHTCSDVGDPPQVVCDSGCEGGWPWAAMKGIMDAGGIELESAYPYKGVDGSCMFDSTKVVAKISNYTCLPTDEDQIAAYVAQNGPVSIALNAGWLQFYIGGISNPLLCDAKTLDHAVLIVGYGVKGDKPYWIVKNSWGQGWGEKGYFEMIRGKGRCGLNNAVSSALI
eukprot:TRINITY_DN1749_c0_g1_i1.p1 TRINITY_DN1749_c0_g1~~TRINITY_DN1749_c0_g1_i1.p1  ORF type:complete len:347 (-),score=75.53 TRINITY_DN1749_c0_g1_i1:61-1080(-)